MIIIMIFHEYFKMNEKLMFIEFKLFIILSEVNFLKNIYTLFF